MGPIKYGYIFIGIILLLGLITLVIHSGTSGEEFSKYNIGWNGTSLFFSSIYSVPEVQGSALDSGSCETLLVLAPLTDFKADDVYRTFLFRGHRVIIIDESGYSNTFLSTIPSTLQVIPGNLSSVDNAYGIPDMVLAYPESNETIFANISSLTLNRPAAVIGGKPLMETSLLSWLDMNGNDRPDGGEVLQRYSVAARDRIGPGEVIVIADTSLFINEMRSENPQLMENIHSIPGLCLDAGGSQTIRGEFLPSLFWRIKNTYIIELVVVAMAMLIGVLIGERR